MYEAPVMSIELIGGVGFFYIIVCRFLKSENKCGLFVYDQSLMSSVLILIGLALSKVSVNYNFTRDYSIVLKYKFFFI